MNRFIENHVKQIRQFVSFVNRNNLGGTFVLNKSTALMLCYNLNRVSLDVSFDTDGSELSTIINLYCRFNRLRWDSIEVIGNRKLFKIYYGSGTPILVETIHREKSINMNDVTVINNILVYKIDVLANITVAEYCRSDKIHDLHDMVFIGLGYLEVLDPSTLTFIKFALSVKGKKHIDYVLCTQQSEYINSDKLYSSFLVLWDKLGLI